MLTSLTLSCSTLPLDREWTIWYMGRNASEVYIWKVREGYFKFGETSASSLASMFLLGSFLTIGKLNNCKPKQLKIKSLHPDSSMVKYSNCKIKCRNGLCFIGFYKKVLFELQMRNAGHMVPISQPLRTMDLVTR